MTLNPANKYRIKRLLLDIAVFALCYFNIDIFTIPGVSDQQYSFFWYLMLGISAVDIISGIINIIFKYPRITVEGDKFYYKSITQSKVLPIQETVVKKTRGFIKLYILVHGKTKITIPAKIFDYYIYEQMANRQNSHNLN
jgi:hypothetical protein